MNKNWLNFWANRVEVSGSSTNWRPVTSVVSRESVRGPLLFNILSYNPEKAVECTLMRFLDDTKLARQFNRVESRVAIQWNLNMLKEWTDMNGILERQRSSPTPWKKESLALIEAGDGLPEEQLCWK